MEVDTSVRPHLFPEIDSAGRCQFAALQLGPRVMRTETAPLAAIAILQSRWGDMGLGNPP